MEILEEIRVQNAAMREENKRVEGWIKAYLSSLESGKTRREAITAANGMYPARRSESEKEARQ